MIYNYTGFLQHKRKNLTANFQLGCIYTERKGTFSLIFDICHMLNSYLLTEFAGTFDAFYVFREVQRSGTLLNIFVGVS